jgi:hypothetical protein
LTVQGADRSLSDRIDEELSNMLSDAANGVRWAQNCTEQADHIIELVNHGGSIWGYSKQENPGAVIVDMDGEGGHDFAIIGEFLVDPLAADSREDSALG